MKNEIIKKPEPSKYHSTFLHFITSIRLKIFDFNTQQVNKKERNEILSNIISEDQPVKQPAKKKKCNVKKQKLKGSGEHNFFF